MLYSIRRVRVCVSADVPTIIDNRHLIQPHTIESRYDRVESTVGIGGVQRRGNIGSDDIAQKTRFRSKLPYIDVKPRVPQTSYIVILCSIEREFIPFISMRHYCIKHTHVEIKNE
jgi:hypothetical protein